MNDTIFAYIESAEKWLKRAKYHLNTGRKDSAEACVRFVIEDAERAIKKLAFNRGKNDMLTTCPPDCKHRKTCFKGQPLPYDKSRCYEGEYDTVVQCKNCGKKQYLKFANGLKNGWSKCCGYTMPIIHCTANIEEAVKSIPITISVNEGKTQ